MNTDHTPGPRFPRKCTHQAEPPPVWSNGSGSRQHRLGTDPS